jgi:hypothetical protein
MNQLIPTRSSLVRNARLLGALMLLLAFSSSGTSMLASWSPGPSSCERACCAGKSPHAAGSCAQGSCHASLPSRGKSSKHRRRIGQPTEQLCGGPRRIESQSFAIIRWLKKHGLGPTGGTPAPLTHTRQINSDQTSVSLASLSNPCQSESGGASSANPNQRNAATLSHHRRPRPSRTIRLSFPDNSSSSILDALSGQCTPRGPPVSFS